MLKKVFLMMVVLLAGTQDSFGALLLTGIGVSATQNFNSLTTAATDISVLNTNGWRFATGASPTFASGTLLADRASSTTGAFTAGGTYNFGGTGVDRGLGAMTSVSFASPNHLIVELQNQTGVSITQLNFAFDWERYRINSSAASGTFFSSSDGSAWTAIAAGNSGSYSTGTGTYGINNSSIDSISRTGSITGLSIDAGQNHYLRWTFNTTGSNSQAIGLDNFSITAVPEPTSIALVSLMCCTGFVAAFRRRIAKSKIA